MLHFLIAPMGRRSPGTPIPAPVFPLLDVPPNEKTLNQGGHIKRTSITLEDPIYETGQRLASGRGFSLSFSAYVAWLIMRDVDGGVEREVLSPTRKAKTIRTIRTTKKSAIVPARAPKPKKPFKAKPPR